MRPVAVFDTNVLFSGVGWKGKPYQCLELARAGVVEGITCQEILDELAEALRDTLRYSSAQVTNTLADLLGFFRSVGITNALKVIKSDPDDDKILECSAVGGASHIVTGDHQHLLPLGSFEGVPIVTPAEFLSIVAIIRQTS